jgi:hypothetical protein
VNDGRDSGLLQVGWPSSAGRYRPISTSRLTDVTPNTWPNGFLVINIECLHIFEGIYWYYHLHNCTIIASS